MYNAIDVLTLLLDGEESDLLTGIFRFPTPSYFSKNRKLALLSSCFSLSSLIFLFVDEIIAKMQQGPGAKGNLQVVNFPNCEITCFSPVIFANFLLGEHEGGDIKKMREYIIPQLLIIIFII
jgi:hypothetical protein